MDRLHVQRTNEIYVKGCNAYLGGFIDRESFTHVLMYCGFDGLNIVEELEKLQPLVKECTIEIREHYRFKNGQLCLTPAPLL